MEVDAGLYLVAQVILATAVVVAVSHGLILVTSFIKERYNERKSGR